MKVHVYDTHVKTQTGGYLHFDVLVSDEYKDKVTDYAQQYLTSLGITAENITQNSCLFCHSEIANPEVKSAIKSDEHYILPLEVS